MAFVDDTLAYLLTLYVCILLAILVGRGTRGHWSQRVLWRLPIAVVTAFLVVLSLRSWALVELPMGRYVTTGHSPYVVFMACAMLLGLLYVTLPSLSAWLTRRRSGQSSVEASRIDVSPEHKPAR